MIDQFYDNNFYNLHSAGSYRSAEKIIPILMKYFNPRSVIDVGCGVGTWLKVFQQYGVDITGMDGSYVDENLLLIDQSSFIPINLENNITLNGRFDLVMSLEVIEHLSPLRGPEFVRDLTELGDIIVFSGAIPGQGGTNHVNERWISYWKNIFEKHEYTMLDCIRPFIWDNDDIEYWYRQNMVVFCNKNCTDYYKDLGNNQSKHIIDIVHPTQYMNKVRLLEYPIYKKILRKLLPKKLSHPKNLKEIMIKDDI